MKTGNKEIESYKHAIYNLIKETREDKDLKHDRIFIRSMIQDAKNKCKGVK